MGGMVFLHSAAFRLSVTFVAFRFVPTLPLALNDFLMAQSYLHDRWLVCFNSLPLIFAKPTLGLV